MIRAMGVEFHCAEVGSDISLDELEKQFAAIFLGMGLGAMQRMGIPGRGPRRASLMRFISSSGTRRTRTFPSAAALR